MGAKRFIYQFRDTVFKRRLLLLLLSLMLLVGVYCIPTYRIWFKETVIAYWGNFNYQKSKLDIEQRKINRFDSYYVITKLIAASVPEHSKEKLLLVPASGYFKEKGLEYDVPEPVVFYYFTSIRTVWAKSDEAFKATGVVLVNNKKQIVIHNNVPSTKMDSLVKALRKYSYPL